MSKINTENYTLSIQLASLPENIRGYGHIKLKNIKETEKKKDALLNLFRNNKPISDKNMISDDISNHSSRNVNWI